MIRRSTWSPATLLVLAAVLSALQPSQAGSSLVSVTEIARVLRGSSVGLRNNFLLPHNLSLSSNCTVHHLPSGGLCGAVQPLVFPCSYDGPVIFQHLGCYSAYETVNLELVISKNTRDITAETFSIPVIVENSNEEKPVASLDRSTGTLSVDFMFTSDCSYTVVHDHSSLGLPLYGELSGETLGQPIPCGLSPRNQLAYISRLNESQTSEAVLVRVDRYNQQHLSNSTYYVLSLKVSSLPVIQLPNANMDVYELSETVISPSLLPLDRLDSYTFTDLKVIFPVLNIGSLYPISAVNRGAMDAIVFTAAQLQEWKVVFRPNETSAMSKETFNYYVTDAVGRTVGEGVLRVTLHQRTGRTPSIRKNTGLVVKHGERAALGPLHLSFYAMSSCDNATLRLVKNSFFGSWVTNGTSVKVNEKIPASIINNGSLLYQHNAGIHKAILLDFSLWNLECSHQPTLMIPLLISLLPTPLLCHQERHNSSVLAPFSIAVPLPVLLAGQVENNSIMVSASSGLLLQSNCFQQNLSNHSRFPFIHSSDLNLSGCNPTNALKMRGNLASTVWFLPLHQSTIITTKLRTNTMCLMSELNVQMLNLTLEELFTPQKADIPMPPPLLPTLINNNPLPLTSIDSVVITKQFLYIEPQGLLENKILFHLRTSPQHGHICSIYTLQCTRSIPAFTQADIINKRIYYKPTDSVLMNDSFEFTYSTFDIENSSSLNNFTITVHTKDFSFSPLRQFWAPFLGSKHLAPKFLRHMTNQLKGNDIQFTVTSEPQHGWLQVPTPGKISSFHFQESKDRNVVYHHNGTGECTDWITLTATSNGKTVTSNLTIAIRRNTKVPEILIGTKLLQDSNSFVLRQEHMNIQNSFCPEFVMLQVVQLPGYGILRYIDEEYKVTRLLQENAVFSAADIKHGLVSYSLAPELIIPDNTTDAFQMKVTEPGQRVQKGDIRIPRETSNILSFDVIILQPEGSGEERTVNFTISSPKWLVQLDNGKYGTIFNQNDFHEWNGEIQPYEILIVVRQHPTHGKLKRRNNPIGEFTLADVYNGLIRYESILSHEDRSVTSDEFRFTVIFGSQGSQPLTIVKTFSLHWCYFYINKYKRLLEESAGIAKYTVRRTGQTRSQPTYVNFTTVSVPGPNNATGQSDCRANGTVTGDFCLVNERLTFSPRKTKLTLSVKIYDNTIAEGPEQFSIKLTNPEGCLLPRQPPQLVWITDYEDYSTVSFSIPQNRPANRRTDRDTCKIEVLTEETVGVLNLNLTRSASNLNQTVGVICYTNTTLNNQGQSPDFISRPNNASSMVYFKPGQRHAQCPVVIVDDNLNEPTDSFFVHLGVEPMVGFGFVDFSSTPVCAIITHDMRDLPQVQFTTTRITVQERKDKIVSAPFNISRTGADLNSLTKVTLEAQAPAPDNATAGLDFFAGPMTEIAFNHGEKIKTGMVRIRPDNIQEGKEVFHIHIKDNNNGREGSPAVLEVVILDAFEDTVISFLSPNITFAESDGLIKIPFNRSGYKAVTSNITCLLTRGTALPVRDYILLQSQRVTLAPGVSKGDCNVILQNDMVKEEEEYFTVTLQTNDLGARLVTSKTTVFITDIGDVPQVSFAQAEYYVEEPLSNYPVDHMQFTITLTRSGDTNLPISVILSTRSGTANEGIDYIAVNTTLHFQAGVNTVNTTAMRVLANHRKQFNTEFYVVLNTTPASESEVRLKGKGEAKIVIKHWVLKGVFFPGLPLIASNEYSNDLNNITFSTLLSHDNPLMCVTPCDAQYSTNLLYLKECTRQRIDGSRTHFNWEISTDGDTFTELHQDTFFTSTQRQLLDPVYLMEGLFVRCTATAIDSNGVSGYSRVSHPIKLTTKRQYHCGGGATATAALSSYNGFKWRSQDLVMLTINLPHLPNTIPLVTSKTFSLKDFTTFLTYPASRLHHTCSNVVLTPSTASQHSLLSHTSSANRIQALYRHYDQTKCQWTFKTWLSLAAVQQHCGAVLIENNLFVSLEVLYFGFHNNTAIVENTTNTTAIFNHPHVNNSQTPFPYVYRPIQTTSNDFYVKLISIEREPDQNRFSVILYSYSPINKTINSGILINNGKRRSTTINNMSLMYSDHQHGTQAWLLNIATGSTNHMDLMFNLLPCVHYSWSSGCHPGPPITFDIPLVSAASRVRTAVDTTIIRQQQTLIVRLKLKATQRLQADYTLIINRTWLCLASKDIRSTVGDGCLDTNQTKKSINIVNDLHAQLSSNSTHMEILLRVDSLQQAGATDKWYMDIRYGAAQRGQLVDNEDQVVLLVPLDQPLVHSTNTEVLLVPTRSPMPVQLQGIEIIPVYAIVLLSLAFGALIVVCGITACFVCYSSRQRLLHTRKTNRPHNDDDDESSTSKAPNLPTTRLPMTNTHSRKIRRSKSSVQLLMQKAAEISRQNQSANLEHNRPAKSNSSLNRSSSLPDLATLRQCPATSTAPSYTLSTRITSRSKAKVATVRPITHVCPPSKPPPPSPTLIPSTSCKVTDKSLDVRLEKWRKTHPCQPVSSSAGWYERHKSRQVALASYAQLYLAAGARTPEPGISPSTKL